MKILLVNKAYHPHLGGVETVVRQIALGMARAGHEAAVLCFGDENADETREGVLVRRVRPAGRIGSAPLGASFLAEFRALAARSDVVNLHSPNPMGEIAALMHKRGKSPGQRIICTYHGDAQRPKLLLPGYDALMRRFFGACDAVAASSPKIISSSRVLGPLSGRMPGKIRVIPLGVDCKKYVPAPGPESESAKKLLAGLPGGSFRVMFAGRLVYYKGVQFLLDALRILKERGILASMFIVGSGPLEGEIKAFAGRNSLADRVIMIPPQPEGVYRALFHQADCFVLPSAHRTEAYGIALLEAMASGLPVISTELGTGTSWINEDGETGFVVAPGDPGALAKAIEALALNESDRERFGRRAFERSREMFDEEKMLDGYEKLFSGKFE
jgi:rhamnosyl/mannosyltransferase